MADNSPKLSPTRSFNDDLAAARERARLCRSLTEYVHTGGGWVTSMPGSSCLAFQAVGADIAASLRNTGYVVHDTGTTERLIGVAREEKIKNAKGETIWTALHSGITTVRCYSLELPGDHPPPPNGFVGVPKPKQKRQPIENSSE